MALFVDKTSRSNISLSKLPTEVLNIIIRSGLSDFDLMRLCYCSHLFNDLATPIIYRDIEVKYYPGDEDLSKYPKAVQLARSVVANQRLSQAVRTLDISISDSSVQHSKDRVTIPSTSFEERMAIKSILKDVLKQDLPLEDPEVWGRLGVAAFVLVLLNQLRNLDSLRIKVYLYENPKDSFSVMEYINNITEDHKDFTLRGLDSTALPLGKLEELEIYLSFNIGNLYWLPNLKTLMGSNIICDQSLDVGLPAVKFLDRLDISYRAFQYFENVATASLGPVRIRDLSFYNTKLLDPIPGPMVSASKLRSLLESQFQYLERLSIVDSGIAMMSVEGYKTSADSTILGSLRDCQLLKYLKIEVSYLLGAISAKAGFSFVDLLPASIETLVLSEVIVEPTNFGGHLKELANRRSELPNLNSVSYFGRWLDVQGVPPTVMKELSAAFVESGMTIVDKAHPTFGRDFPPYVYFLTYLEDSNIQ